MRREEGDLGETEEKESEGEGRAGRLRGMGEGVSLPFLHFGERWERGGRLRESGRAGWHYAGRVRKGGERKPNRKKSVSSAFPISYPFGSEIGTMFLFATLSAPNRDASCITFSITLWHMANRSTAGKRLSIDK